MLRKNIQIAVALFFSALSCIAYGQAAESKTAAKSVPAQGTVVHIMGLDGIKRSAHGKLTVQEGKLSFQSATAQTDISLQSIQDIFAGSESREVGGTPMTLMKMAAPFGTGRAVSLFAHQKVDNLTVEFLDDNGGLHDAIFLMPRGRAEELKKTMVDRGAHASVPVMKDAAKDAAKEKK